MDWCYPTSNSLVVTRHHLTCLITLPKPRHSPPCSVQLYPFPSRRLDPCSTTFWFSSSPCSKRFLLSYISQMSNAALLAHCTITSESKPQSPQGLRWEIAFELISDNPTLLRCVIRRLTRPSNALPEFNSQPRLAPHLLVRCRR